MTVVASLTDELKRGGCFLTLGELGAQRRDEESLMGEAVCEDPS